MGMYYNEQTRSINVGRIVSQIIALFVISLCLIMVGCPKYNVWEQGLVGQAALARATQDRQIAVQEATAKMESAKMLAQAEIERAKGVAQANQIIGHSLQDNEDYLRYLFINNLEHTQNQVIYLPTEAGLPILEATRNNHLPPIGPSQ